jgi:hypothetical protein
VSTYGASIGLQRVRYMRAREYLVQLHARDAGGLGGLAGRWSRGLSVFWNAQYESLNKTLVFVWPRVEQLLLA